MSNRSRGRPKKDKSKSEKSVEKSEPKSEKPESRSEKPVEKLESTKSIYFVYFIRQVDGKRLDNARFLVGTSNNVPELRKLLESHFPSGLKTHVVIKCSNGDAESVYKEFHDKNSSTYIKNGWFECGKSPIESFVEEKCKLNSYEPTTEGKAKIK